MPNRPASLLSGYRVRVLGGNHLSGTQRRLAELRSRRAAGLTGQVLALYDPRLDLLIDVVCHEGVYAQARTMLQAFLPQISAGDCLLADRNFCTAGFWVALSGVGGFFVIREHDTPQPNCVDHAYNGEHSCRPARRVEL